MSETTTRGPLYEALLVSLHKSSREESSDMHSIILGRSNAQNKQRSTKREEKWKSGITESAADDKILIDERKSIDIQNDDSDAIWNSKNRTSDPFNVHFATYSADNTSRVCAMMANEWINLLDYQHSLTDWNIFQPKVTNAVPHLRKMMSISWDLYLKSRLIQTSQHILSQKDAVWSTLRSALFTYHDILFGARSVRLADDIRNINILHILNHIYKTRDHILRNNARVRNHGMSQVSELRDQGFTRPKVLILLETRQMCYRYVSTLSSIVNPEQEEQKERFMNSFFLPETKFRDLGNDEFQELFEGNDDNNFIVGIKLTRKTMKYFTKFDNADMILASPLGLRKAIDHNGYVARAETNFVFILTIALGKRIMTSLALLR